MNARAPLVVRLERSAQRAPGADAIVHRDRRVTYAQLWRAVRGVAGALRANGVRRGDRVAIVLENSPEYVAAYYGALATGAVAVALNPAARARELGCWIAHCGARFLYAEPGHPDLEQLTALFPAEQRRDIRVDMGASPEEPVAIADGDLAAITYTSGTTGAPKGVMLSHGNLAANAASIIEYLGLTAADRALVLLPFFYAYGGSVLHTHLAAGGSIVIEPSLAFPARIVERMATEQVTGLPGVPSTFALLMPALAGNGSKLTTLRYATQAGGAMDSAAIARVRECLPGVTFFAMYGQTEATARIAYLPPARLDDKRGSVGVAIPGVEIAVRDGEVCVRGANVMQGYYADAVATAAVLRPGGWLHTGDLGYLDDEGFLFLQGRRSDVIKSGAHRISPQDIEHVIAALPDVVEVAVVGTPDAMLGEAIKAVVALRPGAALDAMSVRRHCREHLPRYKVPATVEFAARLPRTASGKVMRHAIA